MKEILVQTVSKTEVLITETQIQQSSRLSVRQAAQRLAVSKSKVYRMDREHGPFRFVLDGRRIFIDAPSFELHLANIRGIHAEDDPPRAEGMRQFLQLANEPKAEPQTAEPQIESVKTVVPVASLPESTAGGQRELTMRAPSGPCFVCYPGFFG